MLDTHFRILIVLEDMSTARTNVLLALMSSVWVNRNTRSFLSNIKTLSRGWFHRPI